jgi:predicted nucleic acid-binding protein
VKVISNASPIINLAAIGELELLEKLFGQILIPEEVYHEICVKGKGQPGSKEINDFNWINKKVLKKSDHLVRALKLELDAGESEAIALTIEEKADLLLIDELRGRNTAEYYGLNFVGILGILVFAKNKKYIEKIKPLLDRLKQKAGFRISDKLYNSVLKTCNE